MNAKVAIIVLTSNQKEKTLRCLKSLEEISYSNYRIFLLDNGSTDNTIDAVKIKFPEVVTFYSAENLGVAIGRNFAAKKAFESFNPEYILFLDNDTVVKKDFMDNLVDVLEADKSTRIATPKIMCYGKPGIIYGAGGCDVKFWRGKTSHKGHLQKDVGQYYKNKECIASGGCMLVSSETFRELNGFDENFNPYGPEDLDFVLRAKEKNYKCMYVYNSVIYHDPDPGKTSHQGKNFNEYAKRKYALIKILNERHAPKLESFIFAYIISPLLSLIMRLKNSLMKLNH
jgi:GT2 family glycosyltransferase